MPRSAITPAQFPADYRASVHYLELDYCIRSIGGAGSSGVYLSVWDLVNWVWPSLIGGAGSLKVYLSVRGLVKRVCPWASL